MLHRVRQSEAVSIITMKVSKPDCEFEQYSIYPFLNLNRVLNLSFFGSHSSKHYRSSFLIKPPSQLIYLILSNVVKSDCRYSRPYDIIRPFESCNSLDVAILNK